MASLGQAGLVVHELRVRPTTRLPALLEESADGLLVVVALDSLVGELVTLIAGLGKDGGTTKIAEVTHRGSHPPLPHRRGAV